MENKKEKEWRKNRAERRRELKDRSRCRLNRKRKEARKKEWQKAW